MGAQCGRHAQVTGVQRESLEANPRARARRAAR